MKAHTHTQHTHTHTHTEAHSTAGQRQTLIYRVPIDTLF